MAASKLKVTDPAAAQRIVDSLEKQAAATSDLEIKRLLLTAGCDILDHVLAQQTEVPAARKVA
jgi:hypothetical protein